MPKLTIDHRQIDVPAGTKVIDAAELAGIFIPRFCYHPALGAVGACRVCAVAFVEGPVKGIQMSCMTTAQEGMVVSTADAEAVDFRRHVIEWLMLHHPHDCPVCDEGGHCLLQEMTVSGGHGRRRYPGRKRTHVDQALGPLVQHEMNRCIQCYRCVRYYQEYAGYRDLGVMGIGNRVYFGRYQPGSLQSPFAGNLIDICPTGVFTDKPSRYFGRRWDFERAPSVCLHCALGCNLTVSARYRQIVRHEARYNAAVNGHFICDRGRYGYAYANAARRPRQALVQGLALDMASVMRQAAQCLTQTTTHFGAHSVAVVASPRSSLETLAVVHKACRDRHWSGPVMAETKRGAQNLATALSRLTPALVCSLAEVADAQYVVVVGADPINEAPMLALSLRQVQRRSGCVTVIDPRPVQLPFSFDHQPVHPDQLGSILQQLIDRVTAAKDILSFSPAEEPTAPDPWRKLVQGLLNARKAVIVCGTDITTPGDIALAADLAESVRLANVDTGLFYTLCGANAYAAGLMESNPASMDLLLERIESGRVRGLIMIESDLHYSYPQQQRLQTALERLELLIVMDYTETPLNERAHFFIPTQTIYETGGCWVNQEGRLQRAQPVNRGGEPIVITGGQSHPPRVFAPTIPGSLPQPAWQIVAHLAAFAYTPSPRDLEKYLAMGLAGLHPAIYPAEDEPTGGRVCSEAATVRPHAPAHQLASPAQTGSDCLTLLLVDWTLATDPLSARSPDLAQIEQPPEIVLHPSDIARLGLASTGAVTLATDTGRMTLALATDNRMAARVALIPRHHRLEWQIFDDTRISLRCSQIMAAEAG